MDKKDKDKPFDKALKNLDVINDHMDHTNEIMMKDLATIKKANNIIEMLLEQIPKILGPEGAAVYKTVGEIIPGDKVIIIRYSPTTKNVYLSLAAQESGMSAEEFSTYITTAVKMATLMVDEGGQLTKTGSFNKKIEN